jgi:hypothetical protein
VRTLILTTAMTSQTTTRKMLVAMFPSRRPRRATTIRIALMFAQRTAGFAEWLQYRAETVALELEDLGLSVSA